MVVEADVAAGLLVVVLVIVRVVVVAVLPVDGVIIAVAAAAVFSLAGSLVSIGDAAAGPVTDPDVADGEEEGAGFGAAEEPMALKGPVACSFAYC